MPPDTPTAIHWFRRDLRVSDNTALSQAARGFQRVIPAYIASDWRENHLCTHLFFFLLPFLPFLECIIESAT